MPLLQQRISNLLGGVSQRPLVEMFQNQLQSCDNWIARLTYGLVKRPPFTYVAKLTSTLTGVDSAFMFAINRSEDEKYRVIVRDGTIAVLDAETGAVVTVEDRSAGAYLDAVSGKSYRAVTVGDETYILNQGVTVAKDTDKSADRVYEAMVTVEQADFSTQYTVVVNGVSVTKETVDADTPASRKQITTERIASQLFTLLDAEVALDSFVFTLMGSTIHMRRTAGSEGDFSIDVTDGLGDNGLFLIKGEVESVDDLARTRAPNGTKVKVAGKPGTDDDDFWMEYDSTAADASGDSTWGFWKETVAPSTLLRIDADTMPHKLVYQRSKLGAELETIEIPQAPKVTQRFTGAVSKDFDEDQDGGAFDPKVLSEDGNGFRTDVDGADGGPRRVAVTYNIDTRRLDPGDSVTVLVAKRTSGGSVTPLDSETYGFGLLLEDATFVVEEDFDSGDQIMLTATAVADDMEANIFGRAFLSVETDAVTIETADGVDLTVTTGTYAEGLEVEVTLDTIGFTYDVQDGDTQDDVATGLAALITANAAYTSTATGAVVTVQATADSTNDIDVDASEVRFEADTAVLQLPDGLDLGITTDEFVGDELINITDGSSGTITANSTDGLFTVDAFAGGASNAVTEGDILAVEGTDSYFVFQQVDWEARKAGDTTTNPWPSFVRRTINDVFFFRNRLGLLTGAHVVMSESGERTNFFRSTVIDVLDGGRIDIESAHPEVSDFQHSVVWNRNLFLWSDSVQYELGGEPVLSPKTVRLDVLSRFSNSRKVPPLILGRRILFAHQQQGHVRIYEWAPPTDAEPVFQAIDITKEVPTYMPGEVVQMAGDYGHGLMALICDGDQDAIYIYSYADNPDGSQVFGAWQRATLPTGATARQLVFVDGKLSVITSYADGIFLDEGDYDQPAAGDSDDVIFVDRQVDENGFTDFEQFGGTADDIIFTSGFDYHGGSSTDFARYSAASVAGDTVDIETGAGKYGGDALRQEFGSLSQSILRKKVLVTARQGGRASFHIRETAFTYPQGYIFEVYDDSTRHFRLVAAEDDAGELTLLDFDGTLLATGTVDLTASAYSHVDVQWKLSQTGDGFVKVWVDGVISISVTGIDLGAASEEWDTYGHIAPFGGTKGFRIDDMVIRGQTSPLLSTGHRIWSVLPDSDAGVNEWTPSSGTDHFEMVNDTDPDQSTTRLLAPTDAPGGDREEFGFTLPAITGTIANVQVKALVALDAGAGYPGVKLGLRVGGNTTLSDPVGNFSPELGTSYETASVSIPIQPDGSNWTAEALESAVLIIENTDDNTALTQIWLEVLTVGGSVDGPTTEVELPYEPQVDPIGVDTCNDEELTATEISADRYSFPGTIAEECLMVGHAFTARARLAPFYLRDDQGAPETGGRLQVRRMDVEYNRTQDLKVEVTPAGRSVYTHEIDEATLQQGERRVPIMARGEDTVIELVSDDTGDARVSSIDAEFFYYNRSRRT